MFSEAHANGSGAVDPGGTLWDSKADIGTGTPAELIKVLQALRLCSTSLQWGPSVLLLLAPDCADEEPLLASLIFVPTSPLGSL